MAFKKFSFDKLPIYLGIGVFVMAFFLTTIAGFNYLFYPKQTEIMVQEVGSYPVDVFRADVNQDGIVNLQDIVSVLSRWGEANCSCRPDVNQDGIVDLKDVIEVIKLWGQTALAPLPSNNPAEQQACLNQSPVGTTIEEKWHQFPDGCADICDAGPICTQAFTTSCDCGPEMCWDRLNFVCR